MASIMQQARPLIEMYGDDRKADALKAIRSIESRARSEPPNADESASDARTAGQTENLRST
jgi:hypothetical protein